MTKVYSLLIGLNDEHYTYIENIISKTEIKKLPCNLDLIVETIDPAPNLIICGTPEKNVNPSELAQTLRMQYQEATLYLILSGREGYDRNQFLKNGFHDVFIMPIDLSVLRRKLSEVISKASQGEIKFYRPIKLLDIEPDTVLDFDTSIFLPANNKYIKFSQSGFPIDRDQIERLKSYQFKTMHVTLDELDKFYKYTVNRLKNIGADKNLSETQKKEKIENSIRDIFVNILIDSNKESSFEQGTKLLESCKEITKNYIQGTTPEDILIKINQIAGENTDNYNHASNVSAYAAIFSLGTGIGQPEEMALAGLLHDIGLAEIPSEILLKDESERSTEAQAMYKKHPEFSIDLIKKRKMVVSEKVQKIILQHHECYNGSGYPKGLSGDRILKEAQLLHFADMFDYLTSITPGKKQLSPIEAFKLIQEQNRVKNIFDPNLLIKISKLFDIGQDRNNKAI